MYSDLTPKQLFLLRFIDRFTRKHGYSPSFRQMAVEMNVKSPSTVSSMLSKLRYKGYVSSSASVSRSFRVVRFPVDDVPSNVTDAAHYLSEVLRGKRRMPTDVKVHSSYAGSLRVRWPGGPEFSVTVQQSVKENVA